MTLIFKLTPEGLAALINASADGLAPRTVAEVGLSEIAIAPGAIIEPANELKRITSVGGAVVADDVIHVTITDASSDGYTLRSFALYLDDGTLLGSYGQAAPITVKVADAQALLAVDLTMADGSTDLSVLEFGDTDFLNPPATTSTAGVVELATAAEVQTGADNVRAVTPAGLAARTATDARTGVIELATAAEVQAGVDNSRAVTPAGLAPLLAALSNGLALKAPLANAALTGIPTAPTATLFTNTPQLATMAALYNLYTHLVGETPDTVNQISELAAAIGNDPNFAVTLAAEMAKRSKKYAKNALPAGDEGPIIVIGGDGVWEWSASAYYTGYRHPRCGEPVFGVTAAPRSHEIAAVGGLFSKADHPQLWGLAQESGLVVSQAQFDAELGALWYINVSATQFRAPNLLGPNGWGMFPRWAAGGTDADTANARVPGSRQRDALQNIVGTVPATPYGVNGAGASGAFAGSGSTAQNNSGSFNDSQPSGFTFDASRVARTSAETRGMNVAFHPRIHV